jgi:hypothetical protein
MLTEPMPVYLNRRYMRLRSRVRVDVSVGMRGSRDLVLMLMLMLLRQRPDEALAQPGLGFRHPSEPSPRLLSIVDSRSRSI